MTILFVSHSKIGRVFGGVEVYQKRIIDFLAQKHNVLLYVPSEDHNGYDLLDMDDNCIQSYSFKKSLDAFALTDIPRQEVFANILVQYNIDIVHFQHLMGHPLSLPIISKRMGLKNIFSIHDFWLICKRYNLLNSKNEYCNIVNKNNKNNECDKCLLEDDIKRGSQNIRRDFISEMLAYVDNIIVNTNNTSEFLKNIYLDLNKNKFIILPVPVEKVDFKFSIKNNISSKNLKVAILGNFSFNKGAKALLEVFKNLSGESFEFHVFGNIEKVYINELKKLDNVIIYNEYKELPKELNDMHMALFMSICPETYVMTLSEIWQRNIIPIVTDIGALGERVKDGINGFKVPVNDFNKVVSMLKHILNNQYEIKIIGERLENQKLFICVDEHIAILEQIYKLDNINIDSMEEKTVSLLSKKSWGKYTLEYKIKRFIKRIKKSFNKRLSKIFNISN